MQGCTRLRASVAPFPSNKMLALLAAVPPPAVRATPPMMHLRTLVVDAPSSQFGQARSQGGQANVKQQVEELRAQLGLPQGQTLAETVSKATQELGFADKDLKALSLKQKMDACSQALGVPTHVRRQPQQPSPVQNRSPSGYGPAFGYGASFEESQSFGSGAGAGYGPALGYGASFEPRFGTSGVSAYPYPSRHAFSSGLMDTSCPSATDRAVRRRTDLGRARSSVYENRAVPKQKPPARSVGSTVTARPTRQPAGHLWQHVPSATDQAHVNRQAVRNVQIRAQREGQRRAQRVAQVQVEAQRQAAVRAQREAAVRAQREAAVRAKRETAVRAQREAAVRVQRQAAVRAKREAAVRAYAAVRAQRDAEQQAQARAQRVAQSRTIGRARQAPPSDGKVQVIIPGGKVAGDRFTVNTEWGWATTEVPVGASAGQSIMVQLPRTHHEASSLASTETLDGPGPTK